MCIIYNDFLTISVFIAQEVPFIIIAAIATTMTTKLKS